MGEHDARTCDGCLMLAMVQRAEKAEARLREVWKALDAANQLQPDNFKTGQDHLPVAFREVNFQHAFKAMIQVVNEVERVSGYATRDLDHTPRAEQGAESEEERHG